MKSPPDSPSKHRAVAAWTYDEADEASRSEKPPMPIEPNGTNPSSTFPAERRPAARLPSPIPTARNVLSIPVRKSSSPITSLPKRIMSN